MNIRKFLNPIRIAEKIYSLAIGRDVIIDAESFYELQKGSKNSSELKKMKPPVFIFGPPRSGSTFLVEAMNTHEMIFITNELRVMSFINDLFQIFLKSNRIEWNLRNDKYKESFLQHFRQEMIGVVKRFYLEHMPGPDSIWGDKNPHYSDPVSDPGALDTILVLFPDAKFIHIYRNPREQIYSVTSIGWQNFQNSVLTYQRIVTTGQAIKSRVGTNNYLEVRYEDLCDYGEKVAVEICNFLDIPPSQTWLDFMKQQNIKRIPYSYPVTTENEIGKRKDISFTKEEEAYFEEILGKLVNQLGYE
jgi:hypothetical protein